VRDGLKPDPLTLFSFLRERFPGECFLLESLEGPEKTARYSFIGVDPLHTFVSEGGRVECDGRRERVNDPFEALRAYFRSIRCGASNLVPFSGGMAGYLGYDMIRWFEGIEAERGDTPELYFVLPRHLVCVDHLNCRTFLLSHGRVDEIGEEVERARPVEGDPLKIGEGRANKGMEEYQEMVTRAKEYILEGEIFQVVLSRRMEFGIDGDPLKMYRALRGLNPSPYLFFLDFEGLKVLGSSPEMLVRLEGRKLTTRPLAGTRPRHPDAEEDEKLKLQMLMDEKERAEHLMLVDLHRNDMGRVSKYGTVKVTDLMSVEKFSHVQHIVSNIESEIAEGYDAFDALRSCFPAGTVSGAPKIRAMQIIQELERDFRGPYAGAVGYFDFTGNMDFGIIIRSIVVSGERATIQAGAGIVADSIPSREYEETEHKMGAMISALASTKEGG